MGYFYGSLVAGRQRTTTTPGMLSRQGAPTFCLSQSCKDPVYFLYNLYIQICKDMPCVLVHVFLGRVTAPTQCARQDRWFQTCVIFTADP